jgi:hypothetical protein
MHYPKLKAIKIFENKIGFLVLASAANEFT